MKFSLSRIATVAILAASTFFASTLSRADYLYVTGTNHTILKFDLSGQGQGTVFASGLPDDTYGLALDTNGNLYVEGDSTILRFDPSGQGSVFASTGGGGGGLAFDTSGNLYAACSAINGWIKKFDPSGRGSVFASGLDGAAGLAFDRSGNLYVVSFLNDTIWEFDSSGNGSVFVNSGLYSAVGLAFDSSGNLCVGSQTSPVEIEKFDSSGNGSVFAYLGFLQYPLGLAFDSSGNLYVGTSSVGNGPGPVILKLDSRGNESVFVDSGLADPYYIAIQTARPPAVTWGEPAPVTYGTALGSLELNAAASVPGAFVYSPPGGSVLDAGTNKLSAVFTPTDTAGYSSVTDNVSIIVMQAPLFVTAGSASRAYGTTNPVFSGSIVGLQNGDNITGTYSCSATASSPPGTYPIVPALVDPGNRLGNYSVTTNDGTLTIIVLYTVGVGASPAAGGSASGGGSFTNGSSVTVAASPNPGYAFVNWTENGAQASTSASYTFTLTTNRTLTANFTPVYTVTTAASPAAGGVTFGGGSYSSGAVVSVLAAPTQGYGFVNWTENGVQVSTSPGYTFTANGNRTLTANFAPIYTVATAASPLAGGATFGGGGYLSGSSVTVLAAPEPGYAFVNWTESGILVSTAASYTFSVTANRNLTANFALCYTVAASASPPAGGAISGSGAYTNGAAAILMATASPGYHFLDWTENGVVLGQSNSFTFIVVTNRSLVANFATNLTDRITVNASPSSGGSVSGGGTFKAGTSRTVTATPRTGYIFADWTENGGVVSGSASYTFTLWSDRNLVANFVPNPFLGVCGTYNGLFCDETNGVSPQSCGCFTMTVSANGAYTGSLQVGGGRYSLSGQFDFTGRASQTIARGTVNGLTVILQLDLTNGTDRVTGSVSGGPWVAALAGDRAIYEARTEPAPEAGSYTMTLAGAYGSTNEPAGDSHGSLRVSKSGAISFTATLADGTKVTQGVSVSKNRQWPLYASLYDGREVLWSWLTFTNASDLGGAVAWVKLPVRTQYYRAGFSLAGEVLGARYFPRGDGTNVLGLTVSTNLTLTLEGGGLARGITNRIALTANNGVAPLSGPKLSLAFMPSTGAFNGSVVDPATSKPVSFGGVLLQGLGSGSGFFMGSKGSGEVRLEP